ncbi:serine hydrolase [Aurantimonas sp. VKM B-3413]|uniref:serine hydrolase domain-containing protein n=1 Tax=Aurantimonas sp. VKM B-3413 TaxID=2779401 RepID=UPI001E50AF7C|nr:serine hydrolase [Aurantimonas sp. VKM B-3413]MCB8838940.1 beta-lactamase family protein [Aurantimonas sp. VKM B-3413]
MAIATTNSAGAPAPIEERLDLAIRSGLLDGLHAVLVRRKGETLLERCLGGLDEAWGRPLGHVAFDARTLHDLRSVTKSVTSLLYGIALERGMVADPASPLLEAFPQYADLRADPRRAGWRIEHALNMTLGTEWNEDLPYSDPRNSEIGMERSGDRYRFILDRPLVEEPGERWIYNGGATALIGYLIERGTGLDLASFARECLFDPLGISRFEWAAGSDGVLSAASGLRLSAPDLLRIGELMLARGVWNGRSVVPAEWIARCLEPQATTSFGLGYSHQWYLSAQPLQGHEPRTTRMISAMGNGGQRLFVLPDYEASAVTFSGCYNRPDQWVNPTLLLQRLILPSLAAYG